VIVGDERKVEREEGVLMAANKVCSKTSLLDKKFWESTRADVCIDKQRGYIHNQCDLCF